MSVQGVGVQKGAKGLVPKGFWEEVMPGNHIIHSSSCWALSPASHSVDLSWGLKICISNKFLGDAMLLVQGPKCF